MGSCGRYDEGEKEGGERGKGGEGGGRKVTGEGGEGGGGRKGKKGGCVAMMGDKQWCSCVGSVW